MPVKRWISKKAGQSDVTGSTGASGGGARAYGDFRDYRDVGGGREALTPRGGPKLPQTQKRPTFS